MTEFLVSKLTEAYHWARHSRLLLNLTTSIRQLDISVKPLYWILTTIVIALVAPRVKRGIGRLKLDHRPRTPDVEKRSPFKASEREPGGNTSSS